jgi:hypothetical protein
MRVGLWSVVFREAAVFPAVFFAGFLAGVLVLFSAGMVKRPPSGRAND